MNKRALGKHEVEFVIESGPSLGDRGGIDQAANGSVHLGQISTGDHGGWLIIDSNLNVGCRYVNNK